MRFQFAHGITACKAKTARDREVMIPRVIAVPMTNACAEERFTLVGVVPELVRAAPT
jgi:hypothetical protein